VASLRAGRSLSTARVTLAQDGRPLLEALVSAGRLDTDRAPEWQRASGPPDPLALLQAVDALPPTSFELGIPTWAPTVELTVYLRGLPAPAWLACVVRGQLWRDGWFDEDAEVWDASGRLVAQARQLAGARPPADG
jgi:acyl-CoA thioesterase